MNTKHSSTVQEQVQQYSRIVTRAWKNYRSIRLSAIITAGLTGLLSVFLILHVIESGSWLSPLLKSSMAAAGLVIALLLAGWVFQRLPSLSRSAYYHKATRETNQSGLRYLIDLTEQHRGDKSELYDSAVEQNISSLDKKDVSNSLNRWNRESLPFAFFRNFGLAALALVFILAVAAWNNPDAMQRTSAFWQHFKKPNPYQFTIEPESTMIEQGSRFYANISFEGDYPERVNLAIRTGVEERFRVFPMEQTRAGRFVSEPMELFSDSEYHIRMDEFASENYKIEVAQLPRFRELVVETHPPAYTGLESSKYTYPFSRIEVPEGTEITVRGTANKPLETAELIRATGDDLSFELESDHKWKTEFTASSADTLKVALYDDAGMKNRNPFNFNLRVIEDQYPTVRILEPEAVKQILNPDMVTIRFEARDDYGFTSMRLHYEIRDGFGDGTRTGSTRIAGSAPAAATGSYEWNLRELNLQSADEVVYWIEVFDNDEINGYKSATSGRNTIRAASLAEYLIDQDEQEDEINRQLEDLTRKNQEARDELQQLREDIIENPDQNWEQQRQTEDIMDRHSEAQEQLEEMRRQFDELRDQMNTDQVLSEETRRRYEELQQLMDEIDDPAIMELLEQLRKGLEDMDQRQILDALDNLEFNEQAYQERLERTLELFKHLRMNADLDKMTAMLEELAQQEQRVMETEDEASQAQQQESIREQLDKLQEQLDSLPDKAPNRRKKQVEDMLQELQPEMDDLKKELEDNIENLQNGQQSPDQNRQQQQQIQDQMNNMSQQIGEMRQQMEQQSINVNIFALQSIFQTLLLLSEAQEELNKATLQLEPNSQAFVRQARLQRNISGSFSNVVDSLYQVSKEVPQFGNIINKERLEVQRDLERSVEFLAERNKNSATTAERMALGGINKLTGRVADLIEQLQNAQGGGGGGGGMSAEQMMEQMQEMGQQQQQLNQQIQDMINDMAGDRMVQDQAERLDQMARQQNEIRRQLREMQERGALKPGDPTLSELERLSEEMEDAINDLRGGSLDRTFVERQQNILTRMLETEQAMDQREESDERRGETAEEFDQTSSPEMTLEELEREIRNRLQDPNQTRFTDDYQRLIRMYFEILQEMEGEEINLP